MAPSLVALQPLSLQVDRHKIKLAAQNAYFQDFGAYTGEVSVSQIRSLVDYCIIGHSERRHILGETNKDVRKKVAAAVRNGITPIICIGETAEERKNGETTDVIRDQLLSSLSEIAAEDLSKVIIAYEPVWAISTTKSAKMATPDDIKEVLDLIHKLLTKTYGEKTVADTPVLYGGSVKVSNAEAYLSIPGCDGLLIGGASLIAPEFSDIIEIAKQVRA